jgi:O-antigen ligase
MLAGAVTVIVFCTMLRRHKLLLQGAIIVGLFMTCSALITPSHFDEFVQSVTSNVLYKGKEKGGVLGSRRSPWQDTVAAIKEHPLFGTGFGTSYMGEFGEADNYDVGAGPSLRTRAGTNREHGNSYLALAEYMGIIGLGPFAVLIFMVIRLIYRVCVWMRRTANPYHCAIPLSMVLLAGLIHAFFEDWLTAVGYYLCVFFWTSAFLLQDMIPPRTHANVIARAQFQTVQSYGTALPNQ